MIIKICIKFIVFMSLVLFNIATMADHGTCRDGYKSGEPCHNGDDCNYFGLCAYGISSFVLTNQQCSPGQSCEEKNVLRCFGGPNDGKECLGPSDCPNEHWCLSGPKAGKPCSTPEEESSECDGNKCVDGSIVRCEELAQGHCLRLGKCIDNKTGQELPSVFFERCDIPIIKPIEPNQLSGSIQIENLMDGSCQSLIISQPTLSVDDSQAISLPSSNSLKSISLAPPYDSSNIQLSEAGAIINLAPLFGRGRTMNINFELNSPTEPNTVISVTCPCPLDVKLSSFKATLEAAKEQVALTWEILEGDNAYLNIWGAQLEDDGLKNVTQFNTQPIPIDETAPLMNFSLPTSQLNPGATYFALESVSYEGECVTYCDDIDAVVLGPVTVDLEFVKNLCNQEMKRQIALFGNTGSCVK